MLNKTIVINIYGLCGARAVTCLGGHNDLHKYYHINLVASSVN